MIFSYSAWMALPLTTRVLVARQFGVAKTGTTHVVNNEIVADGFYIQDVERALNAEAIKAFVGVEADAQTLWNLMIAKVLNPSVIPETVTETTPETPAVVTTETKPKRKYTRKSK